MSTGWLNCSHSNFRSSTCQNYSISGGDKVMVMVGDNDANINNNENDDNNDLQLYSATVTAVWQ